MSTRAYFSQKVIQISRCYKNPALCRNFSIAYLVCFIFVFGFFILGAGRAEAADLYMPDNCNDLHSCMSQMQGGDTLIIRNGTYSGISNILNQSHIPPSGTAQARTIIQAENDGGAVFSDGFIQMSNSANVSYVDVIGIKALKKTDLGLGTDHWRFFRCAFTHSYAGQSDDPIVAIAGTNHLLEDCWAWGEGRYGMYSHLAGSGNVIFRRCIVRLDKVNAFSPMAAFHAYGVPDTVFQNCIVLDSDDRFWLNYEERAGAFYTHNASPRTIVDGCMAVNYQSYFSGGTPGTGYSVRNSVGWNTGHGILADMKLANAGMWEVDHCTLGNMTGFTDPVTGSTQISGGGVLAKNNTLPNQTVRSNIFYNLSGIAENGYNYLSTYNALYFNGTDFNGPSAGTSDYCVANSNAVDFIDGNPGNSTAALKYIVRIENGSDLDGTGSGGSDRGATIFKKIGISGASWGEAGWDYLTSENLWPWPNEDRIKSDMADYSYTGLMQDGQIGTLTGARGFTASGNGLYGGPITLTSYIWEYLSNPCPAEACNYGNKSDTIAPSAPSELQIN